MRLRLFRHPERGSVLPLVLLVLVFLGVLAFLGASSSSVEVRLAANERDYQQAVYAAEAGLAHMRARLRAGFDVGQANWTYVLGGALAGTPTTGGIDRTLSAPLNGFSYHVYVYDNADETGGIPANTSVDADGKINVRSIGRGPAGVEAEVEIWLDHNAPGSGTDINKLDYTQIGGGGLKLNLGDDREGVDNWSSTNVPNP